MARELGSISPARFSPVSKQPPPLSWQQSLPARHRPSRRPSKPNNTVMKNAHTSISHNIYFVTVQKNRLNCKVQKNNFISKTSLSQPNKITYLCTIPTVHSTLSIFASRPISTSKLSGDPSMALYLYLITWSLSSVQIASRMYNYIWITSAAARPPSSMQCLFFRDGRRTHQRVMCASAIAFALEIHETSIWRRVRSPTRLPCQGKQKIKVMLMRKSEEHSIQRLAHVLSRRSLRSRFT